MYQRGLTISTRISLRDNISDQTVETLKETLHMLVSVDQKRFSYVFSFCIQSHPVLINISFTFKNKPQTYVKLMGPLHGKQLPH